MPALLETIHALLKRGVHVCQDGCRHVKPSLCQALPAGPATHNFRKEKHETVQHRARGSQSSVTSVSGQHQQAFAPWHRKNTRSEGRPPPESLVDQEIKCVQSLGRATHIFACARQPTAHFKTSASAASFQLAQAARDCLPQHTDTQPPGGPSRTISCSSFRALCRGLRPGCV